MTNTWLNTTAQEGSLVETGDSRQPGVTFNGFDAFSGFCGHNMFCLNMP